MFNLSRREICQYVGFIVGAAPTGNILKFHYPEMNWIFRLLIIVAVGVAMALAARSAFGGPEIPAPPKKDDTGDGRDEE